MLLFLAHHDIVYIRYLSRRKFRYCVWVSKFTVSLLIRCMPVADEIDYKIDHCCNLEFQWPWSLSWLSIVSRGILSCIIYQPLLHSTFRSDPINFLWTGELLWMSAQPSYDIVLSPIHAVCFVTHIHGRRLIIWTAEVLIWTQTGIVAVSCLSVSF